MKTIVIVSAIAEWNGVKPLFPEAEIETFPYGECFTASLRGRDDHVLPHRLGEDCLRRCDAIPDRSTPPRSASSTSGRAAASKESLNKGEVILVDRTLVYDIVELMGDLDITSYYASSLDLRWLADPLPHPARRALIASADSDLPPQKIPSAQIERCGRRGLGVRGAGVGGGKEQCAAVDPARGERYGQRTGGRSLRRYRDIQRTREVDHESAGRPTPRLARRGPVINPFPSRYPLHRLRSEWGFRKTPTLCKTRLRVFGRWVRFKPDAFITAFRVQRQ